MAAVFIANLDGIYVYLEVAALTIMAVTGAMTFLDRSRYITYEPAFIYTSHLTILLAALALAE